LEEIDTTPFPERGGVGKGVTIDRLVAANSEAASHLQR
jgi:hypothetical protein